MAKVKVGGPSNLSTKKEFGGSAQQQPDPVDKTGGPMFATLGGQPGEYKGNIEKANLGPISQPMNKGAPAEIRGLHSLHNDIGEFSGFITDGYLDKQGTHFGEAAKFNYLPPGMDISNQFNAEINQMPLRKIIAESFPGDGWMPAPSDVTE